MSHTVITQETCSEVSSASNLYITHTPMNNVPDEVTSTLGFALTNYVEDDDTVMVRPVTLISTETVSLPPLNMNHLLRQPVHRIELVAKEAKTKKTPLSKFKTTTSVHDIAGLPSNSFPIEAELTTSDRKLKVRALEGPGDNGIDGVKSLLELGYKRYGQDAVDKKHEGLKPNFDNNLTVLVTDSANNPIGTLSAEIIPINNSTAVSRTTGLDLVSNAKGLIQMNNPDSQIKFAIEFNALALTKTLPDGKIISSAPDDAQDIIFAMCQMIIDWAKHRIPEIYHEETAFFAIMQKSAYTHFIHPLGIPLQPYAQVETSDQRTEVRLNPVYQDYIRSTSPYWFGKPDTFDISGSIVTLLGRPLWEYEIDIKAGLIQPQEA